MAKLSSKTKKEIRSAINTFISAFALVVVPSITDMDWNHIEQAAIISVVAAGVRAGVKALIAYFFPQE